MNPVVNDPSGRCFSPAVSGTFHLFHYFLKKVKGNLRSCPKQLIHRGIGVMGSLRLAGRGSGKRWGLRGLIRLPGENDAQAAKVFGGHTGGDRKSVV